MGGHGPGPGPFLNGRMMLVRHHGAGHWIGFALLLAIVVLLGVLIWLNLRGRPRPQLAGGDPALAELRMRYARGDISREDYVARANDLDAGPTTPG